MRKGRQEKKDSERWDDEKYPQLKQLMDMRKASHLNVVLKSCICLEHVVLKSCIYLEKKN